MIGPVGLEPTFDAGYKPAASTVGLRATQATGRIRTCDPLHTKEVLWPTELRRHGKSASGRSHRPWLCPDRGRLCRLPFPPFQATGWIRTTDPPLTKRVL